MRRTLIVYLALGLGAAAGAAWYSKSGRADRWARTIVGQPAQLPLGVDEERAGKWLTVHPEAVVDRRTVHALDCCQTHGFRALETEAMILPRTHPALRALRALEPVEIVVAVTGQVAEARVLRGPHTPSIEAALVRALERWRFEPARLANGDAVPHYAWIAVKLKPSAKP